MNSCVVRRSRKPIEKFQNMNEVKFGEDGDFYIIPSTHEQTFKVAFDDDIVRGMYQESTQRSIVYLRNHSCIEDIISTCNHESLHHALVNVQYGGYEGRDLVDMDVYQEHWAIRQIEWIMQGCLSDDHIESKNEAVREDNEV